MYSTLEGTVTLTFLEPPIDNCCISKDESTVTVYNAAPVLMSNYFRFVVPARTGLPSSQTCVKLEGNTIDVRLEFS
jgi:hypothetical protein